jgi:prephenate dehydratase
LLLESKLSIVAETILPIEHHLIGVPGATLDGLRSVASHPMALAQCEQFFLEHPNLKRIPAEDTAGSVRDALLRGDKTAAGIAGRRAAIQYGGVILKESIQDNAENFTRFVLLIPQAVEAMTPLGAPGLPMLMLTLQPRQANLGVTDLKMSIALRLAHKPGALLGALEPFSHHGINLLKIESRPIHGRPWEYQFFLDVQTERVEPLKEALDELRRTTSFIRILGMYPATSNARH